jgi:hypothetical protein
MVSYSTLYINIYNLSVQTLTTLDLRANKIGKQGIKDLANGLENNKVICRF